MRVLAKGGHLSGAHLPDALIDAVDGTVTMNEFAGIRVETRNTHGTGRSLSSALATRVAATGDWVEATRESKRWLTESIRHGAELAVGTGHGPVSHFAGLWARGGIATAPTAGEVEADWWDGIAGIRAEIDTLPFVRGLGDGTLDRGVFLRYLAQDAFYLRDYARVLADAARLAPTSAERAFWAGCAQGSITGELQLHESWLTDDALRTTDPDPVTTAYLDHLLATAARGDYRVLVAALLPCFWIYQDVGERLHTLSHQDHPYRSWLDTYADPSFAASTRIAIDTVTRLAAAADDTTRRAMWNAFRLSADHEYSFFAAQPGR